MGKNELIKKLAGSTGLAIWGAITLSAFYVTQRPVIFQVVKEATNTFWSIALTFIILIDSASLGYLIFNSLQLKPQERLIFCTGLGLGIFGLAGYGLGATGLANPSILAGILFSILICSLLLKTHRVIWEDLQNLKNSFHENRRTAPVWIGPAVLFTSMLSFLFALLPPADGFDGLFYHLQLPKRLLIDGRIIPYNIPQFWFPSLVEGDFLWGLGLGSERTPQLIHWSFLILTLALVWVWTLQAFGSKPAWWALVILISMPSLPWISAWAYTDMALTFFSLASLYAIWRWCETRGFFWTLLSGLFAGMAMGIKYTSFVVPILCIFVIFLSERKTATQITSLIWFALPALIIASPWYLRNWLIMNNPVYPFVFEGRYWDTFRTIWYNGPGTGIGWDLKEILLLPFSITLGYRDQNFFDGQIGPVFLLLLPLLSWTLWKKHFESKQARNAILITSIFTGLSYTFWTLGVINTIYLWQSRLLFPALIPFAIPMSLGVANLDRLDLPQFRISFIITCLIGLITGITLLDNSLHLMARRPLSYAFGMESREAYFERIQPRYAEALKITSETPNDAYLYFLFEPRSYNMPRKIQPDPILDNLTHDYYQYNTPERIIKNWQANGYTHLLIYYPGLQFVTSRFPNSNIIDRFDQLRKYLVPINTMGEYQLYVISYK
jgi:hypothetical protein